MEKGGKITGEGRWFIFAMHEEGVMAGAKAAVVATIATAIPTLASVRMLPWARANLNHSAQALIISTVAGAAYFIVADKTVLATARKNSFNRPSNA
ncbi:hypothetical protein JHK87_011329 [Glycine soja]|nr:hypothetical protein JHK87_011329 [Glycine soja]